jgi:hypothetical protein
MLNRHACRVPRAADGEIADAPLLGLAQDPEGYRASERLVPVLRAELGVDAHEVGLHGCEGDREVVGDLSV